MMTLGELDWLSIMLRTAVYAASIAVAGGILFYATVPGAQRLTRAVDGQIRFGTVLLLVVEPLRLVSFQYTISGGDLALALDPSMRWMAFETPIGQAAAVRVGAALVIAIAGTRRWAVGLAAAGLMVASFALEGHTASHEGDGWVPAALIIAHLAMVHWWLGALYPLRAATLSPGDRDVRDLVAGFGKLALAAVAVLTLAGGLLMALLAGWQIDPERGHQLAFIAKLGVFALILAAAAANKIKWTPMLSAAPDAGRAGLRASLDREIGLCGLILIVTAVMTSFPPAPA